MLIQRHMKYVLLTSVIPFILILLFMPHSELIGKQVNTDFDILIVNAIIYDGTGNPEYRADIGIKGDRIARIGMLGDACADRVIDASGKILTPGFIDLHNHAGTNRLADSDDPKVRIAPNLISQGYTTVVINSDGGSPWPISNQRSILEYADFGPNVVLMVGHGTVRRKVMGSDIQRPATQEEILKMREMVRQGMNEGAYGLTAGLEYVPGRWSEPDEIQQMAQEIVPHGGVYISHQRSEGNTPLWYRPSQNGENPPNLHDSILETIEIGEKTGATVVASHIKAKGVDQFGVSRDVVQLIEKARKRGVRIYADQYPYIMTSDDRDVRLVPEWARDKGRDLLDNSNATITEAVHRLLENETLAELLKKDIKHEINRRGGADNTIITDSHNDSHIGRSLADIADERDVTPLEMVFIFQDEGNHSWWGGVRKRSFSLSEYDVEVFMKQEWTATATDAGTYAPGATGPVHPRWFGTISRKINRYVLEREVISLSHAIRSSSSLPAQILGFKERGMVREGYFADIVLMDLESLRDLATFEDPYQYPEGIEYVIVNGELVIEGGDFTWNLPGRILTPLSEQ